MKTSFATFLTSNCALSPSLADRIQAMSQILIYSKGSILSYPGRVTDEFWFIEEGLIKSYNYDLNGKCVISLIWQENEIAFLPECVFGRQRSTQYMEVMEDSKILSLNSRELDQLVAVDPEIHGLNYQLILTELLRIDKKAALLSYSAAQRYKYFSENFPWGRISILDAASYLGLTRETVSHIRSRFSR